VVDAGGEVPPAWRDAPEVTVDEAALVDPEAVVTALHAAWTGRTPLVVRLAVDPARFRDPVDHVVEAPWLLDPGLELWLDRLHFLVWANTYDARAGEPVWWWARKAVRLGATDTAGEGDEGAGAAEGDVVLPDGTVAWVDGGPRGALAPGDVGAELVHTETVEAGLLTPVPARTSASPQVDPAAPAATPVPAREADPAATSAAAAGPTGGPTESSAGDPPPAEFDEAAPNEPGADGGDPDDDGWFAWVSAQEAGTAQPAAAVSLAPDQLAAVEHGAGPARIIAPAGSGKTRVLTARLRHLVVDRGYEPAGVVAVAYNRKARDEMAERSTGVGARILTLNALGYDLVATGLGRRPNVIEQRDVRSILEPLVPKVARRLNTDPLAPYLDALGAVRLGLRDPLEVEEARGDVPGLADAFPAYRAELRRRGVVDFDEQVLLAIELLLTDGAFRRAQQARHRHLLVDEFQDLTPAHVLLVRLLACPRFDVFGVGDDDQVIYGHAGAAPRFLTDYERYFPGADGHALEVNYRCPPAVVDAARTLLTWNRTRVPKTIRAAREAGGDGAEALRIVRHEPQAGATELVAAVQGWLGEPGIKPRDVAVLARVGSLLLAPQVALVEAGVPVTSTLRPDVLRRTGLRAALAYLRIAASPERIAGDDLLEVRRRPSRGLPNWADKWLGRCRSIDDVAVAADRIDDVKVSDKFAGLAEDLHEVARRAAGGSTREVLEYVLDGVGLGQAVELLDASGGGDGPSHRDDLEALIQVADLHPDPGGFEPWLRERLERPDSAGGVTLSTVHRVKGREWPRVAVFGATDGLVPHRLTEGRAGVEEERRVFHVAITRGIERVVVLADASRPSPFLAQLSRAATETDLAAAPAAEHDELAARRERRRQRPGDLGGGGARRSRGAGGPAAASDADPALVEALKGWRRERSRADNVPPYVVLNDKYLTGIAERRPADLRALARCPGIGPAKLDAYGDEILDILQAHASS
jgi:DNA helicase-2/ATP-dependent DNA helicase PcrA